MENNQKQNFERKCKDHVSIIERNQRDTTQKDTRTLEEQERTEKKGNYRKM